MSGNKKIRTVVLLLFTIIFIAVGALSNNLSDINYLMSSILIVASLKALLDYYFGFSMRFGISGDIDNVSENRKARVSLLLTALGVGAFGIIWMLMSLFF